MLVLSRKIGERIRIGDGIELELLSIDGRRVKIGIACPRDVPIRRGELAGPAVSRAADAQPVRPREAALV